MAEDKNISKYKSRKWIGMWIVEAILTLIILYGILTVVESVDGLVSLLNVWVTFTVMNVIGYGSANIAEKWVDKK